MLFRSGNLMGDIKDVLSTPEKTERNGKLNALKEKLACEMVNRFGEEVAAEKDATAHRILDEAIQYEMRRMILEEGRRIDGRGLKDIRPISTAVGFLPRTHGSSLFNRGQTQSVGITTLAAAADSQVIDGLDDEYRKHFFLHYNFPPFSTG